MSTPPEISLRKPLYVSWAIDGALAISLLLAVYQGGQFVQRFEAVALNLENLSSRVAALETHPAANNTQQRVLVLEERIAGQDRAIIELKADLVRRLDRIESKVDALK